MKRCPPAHRGVTLVEAGLAATLVAVVAGGVMLLLRPPAAAEQDEAAARDATIIHRAARSWQSEAASGCPTPSQLQHERHLSRSARTDDPWGGRFRVICTDETIAVTSPGRDGRPDTHDDIRVPVN